VTSVIPQPAGAPEPVLEVRGVRKYFTLPRSKGGGVVRAVEDVDLTVAPGEVVGLVGESGCGKSTLGRCILRLLEPDAGSIRLHGEDITHLPPRRLRHLRRRMHLVFQDPYSSLNPRMTVGQIVTEPLRAHGVLSRRDADRAAGDLLARVGLPAEMRGRYPHELSGGQRQRVGLARSLGLAPSLLVADEPVSALDVSVQASILNQLRELQRDMGFSCLFIAHDLATVQFLCDRIAVMYLGRIVEVGTREQVFDSPRHPYTQALLSAAPVPDPRRQRSRTRVVLAGDPPSPLAPPSGCAFHPRCPVADLPRCREAVPEPVVTGGGHAAACHLVSPDGRAPDLLARAAAT
jgi:oligopeptide transport system ATP-binding protein